MSLAHNSKQYLGVRAFAPPDLQLARRAPTAADKKYVKGTIWLNTATGSVYMWPGTSTWTTLGTGGSLLAVLGTSNQINAVDVLGNITLSLPNAIVAPGSLVATTSIGSGTNIHAGTNITSGGSITAGTTLTANLGAIRANNGNLVLGTAGNKIVSQSIALSAAAGANSFGKVTLVGGTVTVSTSAVTSNSIIMLTRHSVGATGANPLGMLSVGNIINGTSFVINSLNSANALVLASTDLSNVSWMIIN
jgi:hypothetical protein